MNDQDMQAMMGYYLNERGDAWIKHDWAGEINKLRKAAKDPASFTDDEKWKLLFSAMAAILAQDKAPRNRLYD